MRTNLSMNLVTKLKEENQDFEWYPTTQEIINTVKKHIDERDSILDCGAGDGRVLTSLTNSSKYAIEKAEHLINAMDSEIVIVGTNFHESTLIDKRVEVIFCNPPYSDYELWSSKIITEGFCKKIFLVIPERWKNSPIIQDAIKKRDAIVTSLGTFDFLKADRQARAKVEILKILIPDAEYSREPSDPFNIWFDKEFDFEESKDENEYDQEINEKTTLKDKLRQAVMEKKGKIPSLVEFYNHEMDHLWKNFKQISKLDADLLEELGTNTGNIREALKKRITGLKHKYWHELFDNLEEITKKLTSKSREYMLVKLNSQMNVDFTESNIYAVLIWVIKNANKYFDNQLVNIVEEMISQANIKNYKSNQKVYEFDSWRYRNDKQCISHYGLELRIVLHRYAALKNSDGFSSYGYENNLSRNSHDFINDLRTIANNLGFNVPQNNASYHVGEWISNQSQVFYTGTDILISVKAFKNGNLHIKFNQEFIKRLNVEFGRLKGWLKDKYQASKEMDITIEEAGKAFQSNKQLNMNGIKLLTD